MHWAHTAIQSQNGAKEVFVGGKRQIAVLETGLFTSYFTITEKQRQIEMIVVWSIKTSTEHITRGIGDTHRWDSGTQKHYDPVPSLHKATTLSSFFAEIFSGESFLSVDEGLCSSMFMVVLPDERPTIHSTIFDACCVMLWWQWRYLHYEWLSTRRTSL